MNRVFGSRSKKTSKLRVTGLRTGNSPVTGEFPAQMASNAENVSIWWRHNEYSQFMSAMPQCNAHITQVAPSMTKKPVGCQPLSNFVCLTPVMQHINSTMWFMHSHKILSLMVVDGLAFIGHQGLQPSWWRTLHNGHDGVSNYQPHDCLINRVFRSRSKKTSKLRVTGLCVGNSPVTGEFPAQMVSNAENVSIWWRHNEYSQFMSAMPHCNAHITQVASSIHVTMFHYWDIFYKT